MEILLFVAQLFIKVMSESGRIIVRVQSANDKYDGSLENGIRSENHDNDGLPSFIVIKYTPDCPYRHLHIKTSFIESFSELSETEKMSLLDGEKDKGQELVDNLMKGNND